MAALRARLAGSELRGRTHGHRSHLGHHGGRHRGHRVGHGLRVPGTGSGCGYRHGQHADHWRRCRGGRPGLPGASVQDPRHLRRHRLRPAVRPAGRHKRQDRAFGLLHRRRPLLGSHRVPGREPGGQGQRARRRRGPPAGRSLRGMRIAFRTGGVVGMATVGLGLLGASIVVLLYKGTPQGPRRLRFGAALLAMFMRVGVASSPRPPTWAPISSARSRPASRRTTRATRRRSPTTSVTTSATAPAWRPTSSSRMP